MSTKEAGRLDVSGAKRHHSVTLKVSHSLPPGICIECLPYCCQVFANNCTMGPPPAQPNKGSIHENCGGASKANKKVMEMGLKCYHIKCNFKKLLY